MIDNNKPRKILSIIEEKEYFQNAVEKLREYGKLLKKKHHHEEKRKTLREIKKIAIELTELPKP